MNPFLPLNVYIPDGEPHVFGGRVYLFGSHDNAQSDTYCGKDYEIFSAPINDLTNWTSKGINYQSNQDPLSKKTNREYLYASDCVKGNDGKFYLYYCLSGYRGKGGYLGPISVAVSNEPDGKYEFLGHVRNKDGSIFKEYVVFDPAVINDNGVIRLYYGTYYPFSSLSKIFRPLMRKVESDMFGHSTKEIREHGDNIMGPCTCVLDDDMLTVKSEVKKLFYMNNKNTGFYSKLNPLAKDGHYIWGHGFFEGSSIRKINDKYYFIYSSCFNDELCYAISDYPDKNFSYGGVIISTGDVGLNNRKTKDRLNYTATTHGSIENINGQWYVFYHRQTHGSDYSRQACAEKIEIDKNGKIKQVPVTSSGIEKYLKGEGTYSAAICCNLTNGHMPHRNNYAFKNIPMVYSEDDYLYLKCLTKNTTATYKYFNLEETKSITVSIRGKGTLNVLIDDQLMDTLEINLKEWANKTCDISGTEYSVINLFVTKGKIDIKDLLLKK